MGLQQGLTTLSLGKWFLLLRPNYTDDMTVCNGSTSVLQKLKRFTAAFYTKCHYESFDGAHRERPSYNELQDFNPQTRSFIQADGWESVCVVCLHFMIWILHFCAGAAGQTLTASTGVSFVRKLWPHSFVFVNTCS